MALSAVETERKKSPDPREGAELFSHAARPQEVRADGWFARLPLMRGRSPVDQGDPGNTPDVPVGERTLHPLRAGDPLRTGVDGETAAAYVTDEDNSRFHCG